MATSWQSAVGRSISAHYVKSKGRNMAQSEFLMQLNIEMQQRNPQASTFDAQHVEAVRRELEPLVAEQVRRTYPAFTPEHWPAHLIGSEATWR